MAQGARLLDTVDGLLQVQPIEHTAERDGAGVRVLSVDDQELFRAVVRKLVEASSTLTVVGEVDCGERAVAAARELAPDMVVMDVVMPGMGGIEAARQIKAERPTIVLVLVSTTHPDDLPGAAAESLVDEILWKSDLRPGVFESIWATHGSDSTATV